MTSRYYADRFVVSQESGSWIPTETLPIALYDPGRRVQDALSLFRISCTRKGAALKRSMGQVARCIKRDEQARKRLPHGEQESQSALLEEVNAILERIPGRR